MSENPGSEPENGFRDFFTEVGPLQMRKPFAQTLGVFKKIETRKDEKNERSKNYRSTGP